MKKAKKFTALILAGVMAMSSSVAVFGSNAGDEDVTGGGSMINVDARVTDVLLPTGAALDFYLDPAGISQAEDGQFLHELQRGLIVPAGDDSTATVINDSSFPISLRLTISVDVDATGSSAVPAFTTAGTNLTTIRNTVNTGTANNMLLYIVPSVANVYDATEDYVPGTRAFGLNTTDRHCTSSFLLQCIQ